MKKTVIVALSVVLVLVIISGLIVYQKYKHAKDALVRSEKKSISLDEKLNRESSALRLQIKEYEKRLNKMGTAETRISELEQALDIKEKSLIRLNEKIREINRDLEKANRDREHLKTEIASKNDALNEMNSRLARDGSRQQDQQEEIKNIQTRISRLNEQLSGFRLEKQAIETQMADLQRANEAVVSELNHEIRDRDDVIAKLKEQIETARFSMIHRDEDVAQGQAEIASLKEQLTELNKIKKTLEDVVSGLNLEIRDRDDRIITLREKNKDAEAREMALNREIARSGRAIEGLQQSLSQLEKEKHTVESQANRLQSTHKATVSELSREIRNRDDAIAKLHKQLEHTLTTVQSSRETRIKITRHLKNSINNMRV